jgi:hypothetical protein
LCGRVVVVGSSGEKKEAEEGRSSMFQMGHIDFLCFFFFFSTFFARKKKKKKRKKVFCALRAYTPGKRNAFL